MQKIHLDLSENEEMGEMKGLARSYGHHGAVELLLLVT